MRRLMLIVVLSISGALLAQETRPQSDLTRENRELKEYVEQVEKRLAESEAKQKQGGSDETLREYFRRFNGPDATPRMIPPSTRPFRFQIPPPPSTRPRGFDFDMPNPIPRRQPIPPFPWRLDPPTTRPAPHANPYLPPPPPPDSYRFRFNGSDVYVIPLRPTHQ